MDAEISTTIGFNIRTLREARGLTREQLAEAINLDTGYLGMCERGERQLGILKTLDIITYFGVTPNDIFPTRPTPPTKEQAAYIDEICSLLEHLSESQLIAVKRIVETIGTL